ncbi:MAG: Hsp20/alpha crystallin family protein [Thiobacillus sp.]|nr:Hsp20/alpha crystallin family protein [Thiobacillus sp.]MDP1926661.1 Hsp20/alpha crystallin family protein [Thiobacillus sp.]MDP3124281.1 Hsp20/alpha crystallin family protein [Thiobacillus sp.]
MALVKWEPIREIEDLFDRYTSKLGWPSLGREAFSTTEWSPKVDISETDKAFTIKAELPEVRKEDIKVNIENGMLSISGERKQEKEEKDKKFHRIERFYGNFMRSFTLPSNVDAAQIKAEYKDGMLNLSLPKTAENKPKATEVKIQ